MYVYRDIIVSGLGTKRRIYKMVGDVSNVTIKHHMTQTDIDRPNM